MNRPCREEALLSAWLDAELSAAERAAVEAHLGSCATCAAELAALRRIRAHLRGFGGRAPEPTTVPAAPLLTAPSMRGPVGGALAAVLLVLITAALLTASAGPGARAPGDLGVPYLVEHRDLAPGDLRPEGRPVEGAIIVPALDR